MLWRNIPNLSILTLITLKLVITVNQLYADKLSGWGKINTIPPSYARVSTPNILRCGKLCQRNGKCIGTTFDHVERMCYLHDADVGSNTASTSGRYMYKKYRDPLEQSNPDQECDADTQLVLPPVKKEGGQCHTIKEPTVSTTPTEPTTTQTTIEPATNAITTTNPTTPFSIDCTPFQDYQPNAEFNICYREGSGPKKRDDAIADCRSDDSSSHLVTILNVRMLEFFQAQDISGYWIDGDYQFKTWNQQQMPWASWCSSKPTMGGGDALIVDENLPCMGPKPTADRMKYICQID